MDSDIYALVAKYGFKGLHTRLLEIMQNEYSYLHSQFEVVPKAVPLQDVPESPVKTEKKVKKTYKKKEKEVKQVEDHVQLSLDDVELKDVIVTVSEKPSQFRDPKEIKEFQKAAIEAKQKENEAAGLEPSHFLTKENLKQWIEKEGRTYAWVAREKAGCAETQVAATAQMMGIKSAISKKRGIMMGSR
jgi:hypothetical protein